MKQSNLQRCRRLGTGGGFTLVETVIALGIVSFAMLGILGMVPVGLTHFREAMSNTAESQIVQGLSNDLLAADYSKLTNDYRGKTNFTYFNDEGRLVADSASPSDKIYEVRVSSSDLVPEIISTLSASAPDPNSAVGQTVCIEVKQINSAVPSKKYSFVVPKN